MGCQILNGLVPIADITSNPSTNNPIWAHVGPYGHGMRWALGPLSRWALGIWDLGFLSREGIGPIWTLDPYALGPEVLGPVGLSLIRAVGPYRLRGSQRRWAHMGPRNIGTYVVEPAETSCFITSLILFMVPLSNYNTIFGTCVYLPTKITYEFVPQFA